MMTRVMTARDGHASLLGALAGCCTVLDIGRLKVSHVGWASTSKDVVVIFAHC